jgi:hypothetical protein
MTDQDSKFGLFMNNEIALKYYDIADDYVAESAKPVSEPQRDALAHYFQLLLTACLIIRKSAKTRRKRWPVKRGSTRSRLMALRTT